MHIKILGTGCPNCKKALEELKKEAEITKVTEMQEIVSYGVMSTPALVVDEKVVMSGLVPNVKEIKDLLEGGSEENNKYRSCSCGGGCC
jgi:small redox-active disulfide protein 2